MTPRTVVVVLQAALCLCVLASFELGFKVYSLTKFLEFHAASAPPTAEAVSRKIAPLLTTKSAEQVYAHVQVQHVELHQQHDLTQTLATSNRESAAVGFAAAVVASILLTVALWLLHRKPRAVPAQQLTD
jgi:uncharacterized membrane protein YvlD (DUF360 family)